MVRQRDLSDPALTLAFPIGFCAVHSPEFSPRTLAVWRLWKRLRQLEVLRPCLGSPPKYSYLLAGGLGYVPSLYSVSSSVKRKLYCTHFTEPSDIICIQRSREGECLGSGNGETGFKSGYSWQVPLSASSFLSVKWD